MATNQVIKKRLLEHLGITRQALDSRVQTIQKYHPIGKDDAVYLIAFEEDVRIDDQLDPDTLERLGRYAAIRRADADSNGSPGGKVKPAKGTPKPTLVKIANLKVEDVPGLSPTHAREAKVMAEKVYPILYVFENSARDIISRVLEAALGPTWWDEVSYSKIRRKVRDRQAAEGDEAWHSKRGDNPLVYLDLSDLAELLRKPKVWQHFKDIFPRDNWFGAVVDDLTVSRRVVAHMNPLTPDDIQQVEAGFRRWVNQIREKAHLLP